MRLLRMCACCIIILSLCGCFSSKELDELAIVMGIGIEKNGDGIECTTQVIVPKNVGAGKDGGSSEGEPYVNYKTEDNELSSCINKVSNLTGKSIYMSHNLVMILGQEAAKDGIYKYLDYFMRDNELRFSVAVLVADDKVKDVLDTESELTEIPSINISKISTELSQTFSGQNVTVLSFVENMMSKQKGTLVPVLSIDGNEDKKKLKTDGAAVFADDKMICAISEKELRGVMWLLGDIYGGDVILNIGDGSVSLRVGSVKSKLKPEFDQNGNLKFNAKVSADLNLVRDDANIVEIIGMDEVLKALNASVAEEITASLLLMQDIGADVYGFGDTLYRRNPAAWHIVEDSWAERFQTLDLNVTVDCKITESGSIIGSVRNSEANLE